MAREFSRSERVASLIQRELAKLLQNYRDYLNLGIVTVSEVDVSRDLAIATIYVTVMGVDVDQRIEQMEYLQDAAVFLRKELGRQLRLRMTPELRFVYDDSIDNGMHMDKLLKDLKADGS
jgi:ribosome-binding factor A